MMMYPQLLVIITLCCSLVKSDEEKMSIYNVVDDTFLFMKETADRAKIQAAQEEIKCPDNQKSCVWTNHTGDPVLNCCQLEESARCNLMANVADLMLQKGENWQFEEADLTLKPKPMQKAKQQWEFHSVDDKDQPANIDELCDLAEKEVNEALKESKPVHNMHVMPFQGVYCGLNPSKKGATSVLSSGMMYCCTKVDSPLLFSDDPGTGNMKWNSYMNEWPTDDLQSVHYKTRHMVFTEQNLIHINFNDHQETHTEDTEAVRKHDREVVQKVFYSYWYKYGWVAVTILFNGLACMFATYVVVKVARHYKYDPQTKVVNTRQANVKYAEGFH